MATAQQTRPPSAEELAQMPPGQRMIFAAALAEMQRRGIAPDGSRLQIIGGPQTDEELLDAVYKLTGHRIPRVTVCTEHKHEAPAKTFCDLYFGRVDNCIWIGNRGGGKTANSGELHGAKCRWNIGYKSAIAGAVEKQGYRAYAEFVAFIRQLSDEIVKSIMSKTEWKNGSETEVLGGTVKQLNGPHPHFAQMDEVDLTTWEPFEEFLNMAQGDKRYPGQQLLTSTRKKAHGIVQKLVKECELAIRNGDDPPWDVRIFCVFETMENVPNCRSAAENKGRPDKELCNCNKVKKGVWDEGEHAGRDRRFDQVCGGRAHRSDGFVNLKDVQKRFKQLSRMVWEAQQECLTPNIEGVVHKWFNERHTLPIWLPRPEFGSIYRSWDWGGQNPHAIGLFQVLDVPVGLNSDGLPILNDDEEAIVIVQEGTAVQFDEIYKTSDELPGDGGFSDLAQLMADRENQWRSFGFPLKIAKDYCDPAGFVAKREVKKRYRELIQGGRVNDDGKQITYPGMEIPVFKSIPAPVAESVRLHISWGESGRIKLVEAMCPRTSDEYDVYHWPDKRTNRNPDEAPVKEDDHAMDMTRYFIWNYEREKDRESQQGDQPAAHPRETPEAMTVGAFEGIRTEPAESPVAATNGGSVARAGRMREHDVPSVRSLSYRPPNR